MAQYECYRNHEHPSPIDLFKFNVCIRYYYANSNHIHHEIIFNNLPTIVCKQFFSQEGRLYLRAHLSEEPLPSYTLDYIITQMTYAIQQSYNIDFDYDDDDDADVEIYSDDSQPREFSVNLILEIQECDIADELEMELVNDEEGYEESIEEFGTCAICMDEFDHVDIDNDIGTSRIFRLPCNHVFHQQCIVKWLHVPCVDIQCPLLSLIERIEINLVQDEKGRTRREIILFYFTFL